MRVPAEIFREYDIRGIASTDLTAEFAIELGKAIGTHVRRGGGSRIVVGRDARDSGIGLSSALLEGISTTGCHAIQIGITPTPVNYWAIQHLKADGGVQITGSHNPPEYNGFKLTLLGESLHGDAIQAFRRRIEAQDYDKGVGHFEECDILPAYIDELARTLKPAKRPMRIVVDAGNGTGGLTALPLYRKLGYDVVPLYCEPDSRFPNHHADPTVEENLEDLKRAVATHKAEVGFAFDGDADRIGIVDRDGRVVWGDRLLILLARAVLSESPGATVVAEVKCSKTLYDDVSRLGGTPLMWRAGHSLIKGKMKECGAMLAGEMSGHIFYKHRYYGFDDAVYAGGRLLEILSDGHASIEERLADVPKMVSTPEIRFACPEAQKFDLVRKLTKSFRSRAKQDGSKVVDIDGARVEWSDGWGLVRPSNTQPLLVLRFEAETESRMNAIRKLFEQEIAHAQMDL